MAISCEPAALQAAAKCFECLTPKQHLTVQTYLLAVIAGGSTDPATLLAQAKCFACMTPAQQQEVQVMLLCNIVNK